MPQDLDTIGLVDKLSHGERFFGASAEGSWTAWGTADITHKHKGGGGGVSYEVGDNDNTQTQDDGTVR